jgi:hypothetical protein
VKASVDYHVWPIDVAGKVGRVTQKLKARARKYIAEAIDSPPVIFGVGWIAIRTDVDRFDAISNINVFEHVAIHCTNRMESGCGEYLSADSAVITDQIFDSLPPYVRIMKPTRSDVFMALRRWRKNYRAKLLRQGN